MKNIKSFVLLSIISSVLAQTANNSTCTTPVNEPGLCIPLRNCTSLLNRILKGRELTAADRQYLSNSQCGYLNNHPLVCCPDLNRTPVVDILPQPGKCGVNGMDRIFRGITTGLDTYSWMTLLEYTKPNNTKGIHCIGVLISKRYVLTAAHCVNGNDIPSTWNLTGVRLGEHDLLKDPDCEDFSGGLDCNPSIVNVPIGEKIIHEFYDSQSKNRINDIALLRLTSDVVYSDFVHPICLPRSQKLINLNYENITLEVAGWNRITTEYSVKLTGRLDVVETTNCNSIYNRIGVFVHDTHLCGNSRPHTYETCLGLPGTPVMGVISEDGHVYWYLAGIETLGACGQVNSPYIYTRITSYIDWIESKIQP